MLETEGAFELNWKDHVSDNGRLFPTITARAQWHEVGFGICAAGGVEGRHAELP